MREISIFVDESGGQDGHSKYYVLTLVFHDQSFNLKEHLTRHRKGLADRGLDEVPFHAGPIMTGHDDFEYMDFETRKSYLTLFFISVQKLPITYQTFLYKRKEVGGSTQLATKMKRDIITLLFDNLEFFQSYDKVKIYYDNGQEIVAHALRGAVEYALSKESVLFRKTNAADFMLAQAADMLCALS